MDPAFPTAQFEEACRNGDEAGLAELVAPLGFQ
jgi:hypothetical protein